MIRQPQTVSNNLSPKHDPHPSLRRPLHSPTRRQGRWAEPGYIHIHRPAIDNEIIRAPLRPHIAARDPRTARLDIHIQPLHKERHRHRFHIPTDKVTQSTSRLRARPRSRRPLRRQQTRSQRYRRSRPRQPLRLPPLPETQRRRKTRRRIRIRNPQLPRLPHRHRQRIQHAPPKRPKIHNIIEQHNDVKDCQIRT